MIELDAKILQVIEASAEGLISVPELLGFSDASAEQLYAAALGFFERDRTARAESVLAWLVNAKPYVARYWTAYAATLQAREEFVEAIRANTIALALDPHDVIARAHRGECCLYAGLIERGLSDLKLALAADVLEHVAPWIAQAERLLALHTEAAALA